MNNWNGLGRLTKDPELRYAPSGKAICHFSIAVPRNKEESDFFECEAWEKTGETISNHVKKGQRILIDGRLQQDRWKDNQTQENRSKIKIVVNRFDFIEPANQDVGAQAGQGQGQAPSTPPPYAPPQQQPQRSYPGPYGQPPQQQPYQGQYGQPPAQYPQYSPGPPPSYGQPPVSQQYGAPPVPPQPPQQMQWLGDPGTPQQSAPNTNQYGHPSPQSAKDDCPF